MFLEEVVVSLEVLLISVVVVAVLEMDVVPVFRLPPHGVPRTHQRNKIPSIYYVTFIYVKRQKTVKCFFNT